MAIGRRKLLTLSEKWADSGHPAEPVKCTVGVHVAVRLFSGRRHPVGAALLPTKGNLATFADRLFLAAAI